jgi:hypothetical protein
VQEGEVVSLGLVQRDKGAGRQIAGEPVALLHQKREGRIGGVVVPLAGGYHADKTGGKATSLALHLDLEGAVQGDHQLGEVVAVAADIALVVAQAEGGGGR